MDLRHRVCVCEEVTGEPAGPGQQSQAARADSCSRGFKQAPACNMDETGVPCRTVRGPWPCLEVTLSLFLKSVIDLSLQGILTRHILI